MLCGGLCWPSLEVAERVGVGGLEGEAWRWSTRTRTWGSCSVVRGPEPEWPLIMPCEARKVLIFSRSSVTLLFSYNVRRMSRLDGIGAVE